MESITPSRRVRTHGCAPNTVVVLVDDMYQAPLADNLAHHLGDSRWRVVCPTQDSTEADIAAAVATAHTVVVQHGATIPFATGDAAVVSVPSLHFSGYHGRCVPIGMLGIAALPVETVAWLDGTGGDVARPSFGMGDGAPHFADALRALETDDVTHAAGPAVAIPLHPFVKAFGRHTPLWHSSDAPEPVVIDYVAACVADVCCGCGAPAGGRVVGGPATAGVVHDQAGLLCGAQHMPLWCDTTRPPSDPINQVMCRLCPDRCAGLFRPSASATLAWLADPARNAFAVCGHLVPPGTDCGTLLYALLDMCEL
jgi:hypothetical protein